jgi:signal peptidase II
MQSFFIRSAGAAIAVLALDEVLKAFVRAQLAPCTAHIVSTCEQLQVGGPVWLVRTGNAGSALGLGQGLWLWVALAGLGVLLIPVYAQLLGMHGWLAISAVGLQLGGALGNLLDRLTLGGATDIIYVGWGPVWNIADVALALGAVLATWALVVRRRIAIDDAHDVGTCSERCLDMRHGAGQHAGELLK